MLKLGIKMRRGLASLSSRLLKIGSNMSEDTEVISAEAEVSVEETEERLLAAGSERLHTQYELDVVNPIELAKALGIRPQQVYNYIRNGRLESVRLNSTQKIVIPWVYAVEFAQQRYSKSLRKSLRIEAELKGEA